MSHGVFERHSPGEWRKTAKQLGDSRDLFRPKTGDIPAKPGVYKWRDAEGRVIYVGKAKNLRNRLTNYFQPLQQLHPRTQTMVLTARSLEWTVVGTELEALTLEYTWIKEFDPRFNVVFRDDKTYPYLAVSVGEEVPRVWVTRNRKRHDTRYFGPYAKVWDLRHSLDMLLKTFPVRSCTPAVFNRAKLSGRPCLLASIGKCSAPCVGRIGLDEHRRDCERLVGVLTGRLGPSFIRQLTQDMKRASADLEFERAARLRDQIAMLRTVGEQNAVVFDSDTDIDVFGLRSDELEASIHAFFVRAGSIRGERNWSVERVEDIADADLMADLIVQVYTDLTKDRDGERPALPLNIPSPPPTPRPLYQDAAVTDDANLPDDRDGTAQQGNGRDPDASIGPSPALSTPGTITISQQRDAVGSTQSLTATDATARAQATRSRRERQEQTGRADLLAPISPVPPEIIVPVEPAHRAQLEQWLRGLRGANVAIHVASRGEKHTLMERANENAAQALQRSKMNRIADLGARTEAMNDVARALGLKQAPLRIECYDISNTIGGAFQVASMVVFEDAVARKSEYRRFAIRGEDGKGALDDLSAMYETLTRRFKHGNIAGDSGESIGHGGSAPEPRRANGGPAAIGTAKAAASPSVTSDGTTGNGTTGTVAAGTGVVSHGNERTERSTADDRRRGHGAELGDAVVAQNAAPHHFAYTPNLIVVDGGRPQVLAAARALHDSGVHDVAVCGLAKRLEEVWVPDDEYPIILKRQSEGMYLLQRVRDEAHRFAITYHRQVRRKGSLRSALDDIPGIGIAYQKRLLAAFGSVRELRKASVEDLERVDGIGRSRAETIHQALHRAE
ncbi:MAG: excinuclease ABC subunit UvrC [Bifidobacterium mongoliense]|jgi:excinuclease ABC subunit C|uniref:excinuclease ABC subunit UvrC n=1 Tax=Bifidobacterium mongoliense TaxID=518643 RepID=UPI002F351396